MDYSGIEEDYIVYTADCETYDSVGGTTGLPVGGGMVGLPVGIAGHGNSYISP
jgi:hypothetical protein